MKKAPLIAMAFAWYPVLTRDTTKKVTNIELFLRMPKTSTNCCPRQKGKRIGF